MINEFSRLELLIKKEGLDKLNKSHVAVFGIGGVGSFTTEALARSGIGILSIIDNDIVTISNINRQLIALTDTIGKYKTEVMKERLHKINSKLVINEYKIFFDDITKNLIDFNCVDYIVDAIDSVKSKVLIAKIAKENNIKLISSMGTGNKLNPMMLEVCDIKKTSVCPLAKVMRKELKKNDIHNLKVIFSKEIPIKTEASYDEKNFLKHFPGSTAFVPSVAGLIIASEVVKDILNLTKN